MLTLANAIRTRNEPIDRDIEFIFAKGLLPEARSANRRRLTAEADQRWAAANGASIVTSIAPCHARKRFCAICTERILSADIYRCMIEALGSGPNQGIAVARYRATAIVSTGVELKKKQPAS